MRTHISLEKRKLKDLIDEYSRLGYEVFAEYKGYQRPEVIGDFVPDLVAKKGDKIIIVEVVTKRDLPRLGNKMEQLSEYADRNENVRFDIVLTNPKPRLSKEEKKVLNETLLSDIQKHLFMNSRDLYEKGYYESSYLILTILFENILRKFAIKKRVIDIHKEVPIIDLANLLFESGKVSRDNLVSIKRFLEYRNRIIHYTFKPEKQDLKEYINFVSYFIDRVSPEIRKKTRKKSRTVSLEYLT